MNQTLAEIHPIQTEQIQLEQRGITHPWQEHLPQYQNFAERSPTEGLVSTSEETILQKGVIDPLAAR